MREEVYWRIDDLPESWDASAPAAFHFRRPFLKVMAEGDVEGACYRYLVLHGERSPAALAVLSRFLLRLDLLSGDGWVRRLRRWAPGLLDVPMVCCGIPASFGQHHLHLLAPQARAEAFARIDAFMAAWARDSGCGLLVWKEWDPSQGLREHARALGYAVLPTLPDHVVEGLPADIDAFLGRLRSSYRRKYQVAARLLRGPGPVWRNGTLRLEERAFTPSAVGDFHRGYGSVLERTPVRLETYPPAFFDALARSPLGVRTLHLIQESSGQYLTALLIPSGGTLTFALVAKERARYDDALYTLLLQCIVLYAIRRGFHTVCLGQTSAYAKCSVGARPRRLEAFIRMTSPLKHRLFTRFGPWLFPEVGTPALHVFKEGAPASSAAVEATA